MAFLSNLFFNGFNTYFLQIPVLINWIFIGLNLYFYDLYSNILFLSMVIMGFFNLILLFHEDYLIFNHKIQNELGQLIIEKSNFGVLLFNQQGVIITINDNFKNIFQNNEILKQFNNLKSFLDSLPDSIGQDMEKIINVSIQSGRIGYHDIYVNNTDYKLTFEKLPHEQWIFMVTCQVASVINKAHINQIHDKTLSIYDANSNIWQDVVMASENGYFITDLDGKIINVNKIMIQLFNQSFIQLKYASLETIVGEKIKSTLMDFNYNNGMVLINQRTFYWTREPINNFFLFHLVEKNYQQETNNLIKNYQEEIIQQNSINILIFDDEQIIYTNNSSKNIWENKKPSSIDGLFPKGLIQEVLKRWEPLQGDNFLDINKSQLNEGVLKNNVEKIRIYPMVLSGIKIFNIIDLSYYFVQEQQLLHAQRLMTTGEILSGIIHDLNNYLMPILGYTENVFTKINVYDPIYNNMIHLQNNAIRAANLVKYLLNMSKKNTDNGSINNLNLKIAELLRSMAKIISKNIEIKFKQDPEVKGLQLSNVLLEQIITNLLINSRDAIIDKITENPEEKGLIYITTEFLNNHYGQGHGVKIKIFDNGKGIPPLYLKKIFDPFFTTKNDKGMGLGLATVKKIIEDSQGSIEVSSQEGISTEIAITLPSLEQTVEEDKSPYITGNDPVVVDSGTILIVEDEHSIRRLLKEHLIKSGYKIIEAENGQEALKKIESIDHIDILLSDVMLPDMSIVAMVKEIQKKYPAILIILSSGTTEDQVEDIIQKSFHYTFLNKPFPLNTILNTIRTLKIE
jgi:signal transduction histidine kinase/CheY-like chemotaxis protein/PAS domain-containing protein